MKKYIDFIIEAKGLNGTLDSEGKGLRHIKNYVLPYLSAEAKKKSFRRIFR